MPNESPAQNTSRENILKLYAIITLSLVLIALVVLVLPRGTPLQQCLSIILPQSRDACLATLAFSSGNSSICAYTGSPSMGSCYSAIAVSRLSPPLCQRAGSASSIGACIIQIANRTLSTSTCSNAALPYRDLCIQDVAVATHSSASCSAISNLTTRSICASIISINFASSTLAQSYCANVSNSTNRTVLGLVASATSNIFNAVNLTATLSSLASAPFLSANFSSRDMCYALVASKTGNSSICKRAASFASSLCSSSISGNYSGATPTYTQLLANCNQLTQYRAQCVQYVKLSQAISTRNASICGSFPTSFGWECYSAIAAKYGNATFCGYISNSTANNSCLAQLK